MMQTLGIFISRDRHYGSAQSYHNTNISFAQLGQGKGTNKICK